MKKNFIFFAIFCAFSVNIFAQSSLTKSDYEIYAEVLRDIRRQNYENSKTRFPIVILSRTYANLDSYDDYTDKKYRGLSKDFKRKNRVSLTFRKIFPVRFKYEIADESEIEKLLNEGKKEVNREMEEEKKSNSPRTRSWSYLNWKYFNEKYPKSNGYYKFSRIGYSLNKRFAEITTEGCGESWDSNSHYLFEKIGNKWTIIQSGGGFSVA